MRSDSTKTQPVDPKHAAAAAAAKQRGLSMQAASAKAQEAGQQRQRAQATAERKASDIASRSVAVHLPQPPEQTNPYMDRVDEALDGLQDYSQGTSPVDGLIANRRLTEYDASAATTTLAQAQRIAQNPHLTEGAKQAAVAELDRRISIDRSNLVGGLTETAQERAYQSTKEYGDLALRGSMHDWAMTRDKDDLALRESIHDWNMTRDKGDLALRESMHDWNMTRDKEDLELRANMDEFLISRGMSEEERAAAVHDMKMEQEYVDISYSRVVGWRDSNPDASPEQVLSHVLNDPLTMEALTNWYQSTGAEGVPPAEWVASAISNMNTSSEDRRIEIEQQFRAFTDDPEFLDMLMSPEMMTLLEYGVPISKGDGAVNIQFGDNDILRIGMDTEEGLVYERVDNEGNPINRFGEDPDDPEYVDIDTTGKSTGDVIHHDGKTYIVKDDGTVAPHTLPANMSVEDVRSGLESDGRWLASDSKYLNITSDPHLVHNIIEKYKGDYDNFGYEQFIDAAKKEATSLVDSIPIDESGRVTGSITPEQAKTLSDLVPLLRDEGSDFVVPPTSTKYATEGSHLTSYNSAVFRADRFYYLKDSVITWAKQNRGKLYEEDGRVYIVGGYNNNVVGGLQTEYIELFDLETSEVKKIGRGSHNGNYRHPTTHTSPHTIY